MSSKSQMTVHASCVSVEGKGLLIFGEAGAGKSTLALQMIDLGADFLSDDRTILSLEDNRIYARPPHTISGLIEARGLGVLKLPHIASTQIVVCVDLDQIEVERLPKARSMSLLDVSLPCLHKVESPVFPSVLMHYLRGRKVEE
jgi:HPr kinase/phosphorylase